MIEINIKHKILTSKGVKNLDINQNIPTGHFVLVKGNSGVGKTMFFRIFSGLTTPDYGYIKVNNTIFLDTDKNLNLAPQKRNTAMMFQNYALFPNMTVKQNIGFAQKEKNTEIVDDMLISFDLKLLENTYPSQLSGGQQQRVALARTLVQSSEILLLDEPFSAVDLLTGKIMMDRIIRTVSSAKSTYFIISHNEIGLEDKAHVILNIE